MQEGDGSTTHHRHCCFGGPCQSPPMLLLLLLLILMLLRRLLLVLLLWLMLLALALALHWSPPRPSLLRTTLLYAAGVDACMNRGAATAEHSWSHGARHGAPPRPGLVRADKGAPRHRVAEHADHRTRAGPQGPQEVTAGLSHRKCRFAEPSSALASAIDRAVLAR